MTAQQNTSTMARSPNTTMVNAIIIIIVLLLAGHVNAEEDKKKSFIDEHAQPLLGLGYSSLNLVDAEIGTILSAESGEDIIGPAIIGGAGIDGGKLLFGFSRGQSRMVSYSLLIGKQKPWNGDKAKTLIGFRLAGFIRLAYYYAFEDSHQFDAGIGF